jgi:hypothetical protein
MRIAVAVLALILLSPVIVLADADRLHERGSDPGTGSWQMATAPTAGDAPSAMPRNTAERLYALRPELIMVALVGPLLLLSVVLAIGMLRSAFHGPRPRRP